MTRLLAMFAMALVVAFLALTFVWAVWTSRPADRFAGCREGQIAGGAGAIGGEFSLVDQSGRAVTDRDIITQPVLIYFGYTFCPDVCPLDNARNAEAADILEEKGLEVTPVFISVDPARDTPEVLADYAENLHPRMIGLTGTEDQIRAVTQAFKAYFKLQDEGGEFYLVDHSTFTYLVLPETGFVEFFRREESADQVADRAACFIDAA